MRYSLRSEDAHDPNYQVTVSDDDNSELIFIGEERLTSDSPKAQLVGPLAERGLYYTTREAVFIYKALGRILGASVGADPTWDMSYLQRARDLVAVDNSRSKEILANQVAGLMRDAAREAAAAVEERHLLSPDDYKRVTTVIKAQLANPEERRELLDTLYVQDWRRLEELANQLEDLPPTNDPSAVVGLGP